MEEALDLSSDRILNTIQYNTDIKVCVRYSQQNVNYWYKIVTNDLQNFRLNMSWKYKI